MCGFDRIFYIRTKKKFNFRSGTVSGNRPFSDSYNSTFIHFKSYEAMTSSTIANKNFVSAKRYSKSYSFTKWSCEYSHTKEEENFAEQVEVTGKDL